MFKGKKHKFSIRKFSIGICSVVIATLLFLGYATGKDSAFAISQNTNKIEYRSKNDLKTNDKKHLKKNVSILKQVENADFLMVYKAKNENFKDIFNDNPFPYIAGSVGTLLLGFAISQYSKKYPWQKALTVTIAIAIVGGIVTKIELDQFKPETLSQFNRVVQNGTNLDDLKISLKGWQFYGYVETPKKTTDTFKTDQKEKSQTAQTKSKENSTTNVSDTPSAATRDDSQATQTTDNNTLPSSANSEVNAGQAGSSVETTVESTISNTITSDTGSVSLGEQDTPSIVVSGGETTPSYTNPNGDTTEYDADNQTSDGQTEADTIGTDINQNQTGNSDASSNEGADSGDQITNPDDKEDTDASNDSNQTEDNSGQVNENPSSDNADRSADNPTSDSADQSAVAANLSYTLSSVTQVSNTAVNLQYALEDAGNHFVKADVQVYDQSGNLVESTSVNGATTIPVSNLNYNETYTIKTTVQYTDSKGQVQTQTMSNGSFELTLKKLELKNIVSADLYRDDNGDSEKVVSLSPSDDLSDLSNYFVKIKTSDTADITAPISSITKVDNAYQITVDLPDLIAGDTAQSYTKGYSFTVPAADEGDNTSNQKADAYDSFDKLVEAMNEDPTGHYSLSSDVSATEIPDVDIAYVTKTFTGELDGNGHTISDLEAPLFSTLNNATITDVTFKTVHISKNADNVAALAQKVGGSSNLNNIAVSGDIEGTHSVAGLVNEASGNTRINNVAFSGSVTSFNEDETSAINVAALVGQLSDNASLTKGYTKATIKLSANSGNQRAGSLVAHVSDNQASLTDSYASGQIMNDGDGGQVGGITGTTWFSGQVDNVVSAVAVDNGNIVYGDSNYTFAKMTHIYIVDSESSGTESSYVTAVLSSDEAAQALDDLAITAKEKLSTETSSANSSDYQAVRNYLVNDEGIAYNNVEKLLPFYNKSTIAKYANKLSGKLANTPIVSVTPLQDGQVASDLTKVTTILVYFEDGSSESYNITYKGLFDQLIAEYLIDGTGVLYTPNAFIYDTSSVIDSVLPTLKAVDYDSDTVKTALGISGDDASEQLVKLDLEDSFQTVQGQLSDLLQKVLLTSDRVANLDSSIQNSLVEKILNHKAELLLGLSYMQRWYNIDFDQFNIQDLATFHQDFYGKAVNTLDFLIDLGEMGYDNLNPENTVEAYKNNIAENTGLDSLFDYLESNVKAFTDYKSNDDWFKASTKAYVVEVPSQKDPQADVSVYDRLKNNSSQQNGILPLLTAHEGIYVISTMSTLEYGMYDVYLDMSLKDSDPDLYAEKVANLKTKIDQVAQEHAHYLDTWYGILPSSSQETLSNRLITVWDTYQVRQNWLTRYSDSSNQAMKDFFEPIGRGVSVANGAAAYANGNAIYYVSNTNLSDYGVSVFTHEMTHDIDKDVLFEGNGRRQDVGAENYADGLLQTPSSYSSTHMGLNMIFDYSSDKDKLNRYQNTSYSRFESTDDLQNYMSGSFDVLYTLNAMEANSILSHDDSVKQLFFDKIENDYITDSKTGQETSAGNSFRPFTDEEIANIKTLKDLIDNDAVSTRSYQGTKTIDRNSYNDIDLFNPIYSALSNSTGAPGDVMFREMAFELLAAKGYQEGFLPYVSNELASKAEEEGSMTYDSLTRKEVPLVTDDLVFDSVFDGEYSDWKAFKLAMFEERIAKEDQLDAITINYLGDEIVVSDATQMQSLMDEAVQYDIDHNTVQNNYLSRTRQLKKAIYNAYLRETNDFTTSIYS